MLFRADASLQIGTGHVMRCLTLAEGIRRRGGAAAFVSREHDGNLNDLIERRGFDVHRLPVSPPATDLSPPPAHAAWLGATWMEDVEQTAAVIRGCVAEPDWLVVDHYALDYRYEAAARAPGRRIMVIDDLADRVHDCDVLLDQNVVVDLEARYIGKVPEACSLLLGPGYALLHPMYADLRCEPRQREVQRILIFFGGGQRVALSGRVLSAFLRLERPDIHADLVLGERSASADAVLRLAAPHPNVTCHGELATLAPLMAAADLAVGAGGATTWERLCLGLPCIVVTIADNQRPIADQLNQLGLVRWLGDEDAVGDAVLAEALAEAIASGVDVEQSRRAQALVDGKGAERVATIVTATSSSAIAARHATAGDEKLLLDWANDPATRDSAFSSAKITDADHHEWYLSRLQHPDRCRIYVAETSDGTSVGQVRFDRAEETWEIDYAVAPLFRGRGLGRPVLDAGLRALSEDVPNARLRGIVKLSNRRSQRVFIALGFEPARSGPDGPLVYTRVL